MSRHNLVYNEVTGKFEAGDFGVGTTNPFVSESGTATLTNKTLTAPTLTAVAITGTSTIGAGMTLTAPTIAAATITGTVTVANGATLTTPVINNPAITGPAPVAYTSGTTISLTQALHANRILYTTDVASQYVLPAATGTGDKYTIFLGATQTGAGNIVRSGSDVMVGDAWQGVNGAATVNHWTTSSATSIDLLGTANSTGGIIGGIYEFWDVAAAVWAVRIMGSAAGTEATPFS